MQRIIQTLIVSGILFLLVGCSNGSSDTNSKDQDKGAAGGEESYDLTALSGAWVLESDASSLRPYLITDGQGVLVDSSIAGGGSGTYQINPDGAFILHIDGADIAGRLKLPSSGAGSISFDRYGDWNISKVRDLSGCQGTWQGTIRDVRAATVSQVIITIDSQGAITSAQGLEEPVAGRMLSASGKIAASITTGNEKHTLAIKATLSGDSMTGAAVADSAPAAGTVELKKVVYGMDNAVSLLLELYGVKKGLIINGDDLAMGHFTNDGIFAAWDAGAISSMSLFTVTFPYTKDGQPIPGDSFAEALQGIREREGIDVGCHLTLSSTDGFLVRPVLPPGQIPTLVDANGYLKEDQLAFIFASRDEIKAECRAQIEKALASGVELSHLDCHVGFGHFPGWPREVYAELADEYRLPLRWVIHLPGEKPLIEHRVLTPINFIILNDSNITEVTPEIVEERKQSLLKTLRNLPDGITEVLCHPSREKYDDQAWRILDYMIVTDPEVRAQIDSMCASGELVVLGFNDLKQTMQRL
jgi:chitin disaccharide deacetylase